MSLLSIIDNLEEESRRGRLSLRQCFKTIKRHPSLASSIFELWMEAEGCCPLSRRFFSASDYLPPVEGKIHHTDDYRYGHLIDVIGEFLNRGADINSNEQSGSETVLEHACDIEDIDMAGAALHHGAKFTMRTLEYACKNQRLHDLVASYAERSEFGNLVVCGCINYKRVRKILKEKYRKLLQ